MVPLLRMMVPLLHMMEHIQHLHPHRKPALAHIQSQVLARKQLVERSE